MKNLFSIEWLKLKKLTSLKVIFIIYAALFPLVLYAICNFFGKVFEEILMQSWNPYEFPDIWKYTTYASSYFNVLMGVVVVIAVTNEYTFKTLRQNVIDGLSVRQAIVSKFLVVLFFSTVITLYTMVVALAFGLVNTTSFDVLDGIYYLLIYYLQTLCYFSFAYFLAVLLKKPALSIILFIVAFIAETIIGTILSIGGLEAVYAYFPLNVFSKLTPIPVFKEIIDSAQESGGQVPYLLDMPVNILMAFIYMALFFLIAFRVMRNRDI